MKDININNINYHFNYLFPTKDLTYLNEYIKDKKSSLNGTYGFFTNRLYNIENLNESIKDREIRQKENTFSSVKKIQDSFGLQVIMLNQNDHTSIVHYINEDNIANYQIKRNLLDLPLGDAIVTKLENVILTVRIADCVPIILKHKKTNHIAVVHSGWKGGLKGINENTINLMEKHGCPIEEIDVFVGPSIMQENYEVKEDLYMLFMDQSPENKRFFKTIEGNIYFDNRSFVLNKYKGAKSLLDFALNTFTTDLYSSYRRSKEKDNNKDGLFIRNFGFISNAIL